MGNKASAVAGSGGRVECASVSGFEAGAELRQLLDAQQTAVASLDEAALERALADWQAAKEVRLVLLLLTDDAACARALRRCELAGRDKVIALTPSDVTCSLLAGNVSEHRKLQLALKAGKFARAVEERVASEQARALTHVVLVIGGGGREHAIAECLARSDFVSHVWVAPGNGGTASGKISNATIASEPGFAGVLRFVAEHGVGLVVVGPEQPLVDGIADALAAAGVKCFGPSAAAAEVEASKAWSKAFMRRHSLPTAAFETFTDVEAAVAYIRSAPFEVVVKASGLAAGKGVVVPADRAEAEAAARSIMGGSLGAAGRELVVEQLLDGEEVSVLAFCDGRTAVCMPGAQDHKRALDGDQGPNTGGMGAYAPAPILTPGLAARCAAVVQRSVDCLAAEGRPFTGVLYAGFMVCAGEPLLLEYNCRLGDPETQALLPLLDCDLLEVLLACCAGSLDASLVRWRRGAVACTVVCAAPGYPGVYPSGAPIRGLAGHSGPSAFEGGAAGGGVSVFHAGTAEEGGRVVSSGGRVLAVTGVHRSLAQARAAAYRRIDALGFEGMHFRADIGHRALAAPIVLGVLGSTRGSSVQAVIDAIREGSLNATIALVVSDRADAPILQRAQQHGIPHLHVQSKGRARAAFDADVSRAFDERGVQAVLLVGYMRILGPAFIDQWRNRCLNVHPSLLPEFAGGMDLQVHAAVLAAGRHVSGCTVHQATEQVDGGPVVLQARCAVLADDTPESLRQRVQALEGPLFVRAVELLRTGADSEEGAAPSALTYRGAGVDMDAGEALVEAIKPLCKATRRSGCDADLGGFGGLFDLSAAGYDSAETILVSGTDGVGTKLKIAQAVGVHDTIGVDLVAMCVNDILVCGAEPLFFLDYYATGRLDVAAAAAVVKGIAEGCLQAGAGLIGGETAEMSGMYAEGEYDLAGFAVGAVARSKVLPRGVAAGDVLIGLRSSGVHSNGYSLVRRVVERSGLEWSAASPFSEDESLGVALLRPTRIYVKTLMPLIRRGLLKGMAHITGGGLLDNLPRILPPDLEALVDFGSNGWTLPPVFRWLQSVAHLPQEELLRTFNCGVGMVLAVAPGDVDEVMEALQERGEDRPLLLGALQSRTTDASPQVNVRGSIV